MTRTSTVRDDSFHIATQRSLVEEAIRSDHPSDLAIRLHRHASQEAIDCIVRDIERFGQIYSRPDLRIGHYSIGISPTDRQTAQSLLEYCDRNHSVDHVDLDEDLTLE